MSNSNLIQRIGLGPFDGLPTNHNENATLGLTPVKPVVQTCPPGYEDGSAYLCRILNPSTTNLVAYGFVRKGVTTPLAAAFTADLAATGQTLIPAGGGTEYFSFSSKYDLVIVGSAAGTSCQVTTYFFGN